MDKKKLALTMAVATTLTVSSVSGSLPTVVYAQESTNVIENEENVAENSSEETTLPEVDLPEETTLPEESMPEEEDQAAAGTENVENSEEADDSEKADSNVVEQKTEETSVQEEKANDENVSETANNNLSGNCGATENDNVTWELRQNNSDNSNPTYTLTIDGTGAMKDFKYSKDKTTGKFEANTPWHEILTRDPITKMFPVTELVIGDDVTYIGSAAFASLAVKNISFAQNVTGYGKYVFIDCALAETVDWTEFTPTAIPDGLLYGNSSLVNSKISDTIFENKLVIPENVDTVGISAFLSCTSLTEIDLTNITKSIGENAFGSCTNLKTVKLPMAVDSGYEASYFGPSCFNTTAIETIILPNNVTTIPERMFNRCGLLTDVVTTNSITTIGKQAFFCDDDSVKLPSATQNSSFVGDSLNLSNVTTIGQSAFSTCSNLKSVIHLDSIQSLENRAFCDCSSVQVVDMSKASKISTILQNALGNLDTNSVIYISDTSVDSLTDEYQGIYTDAKTALAITNGGTFTADTEFKNGVLAAPVKDDYVFNGWYDNDSFNGEAVTTLQAGKTYYAKWTEKTEPTISFKDDLKLDKAYDGQAVSISENDYTLTDGAGDVTFTYQMKNGDTWADVTDVPVNVGTYRVKAVVAENDNYKGAETDWKEFTIRKAKPAYTLPDDLVIGKGKTLATVTLPNGFAWADETQTADELGTHEFKAVYTPEDTANYETVEVMIPVEVVPNTSQVNHAPEIEVSDKTLIVGDAFDPMENVVVKDKEDKAEDLVVDVTHNVDMSKAGVYEVTYTVTDTKGAVTVKKIYVTVNPKTDVLNEVPTIHAENVTITVGDQFDPLKDVTAADKEDGTLTDKIEVLNNSVDVNKAGVYEVTYKVTDSNGATVTKTITVTVKEKEAGTPTPPEKPSAPSQPDNPTKPDSTTKPDNTAKPGDPTKPNKTDTPKTGDMANFGVFASMLAGSSGALAVLWKKRRKDNEND